MVCTGDENWYTISHTYRLYRDISLVEHLNIVRLIYYSYMIRFFVYIHKEQNYRC